MYTSPTQTQRIDEQVKQIMTEVFRRKDEGTLTGRDIAIALEANQAYIEYLDLLKDNIGKIDCSVTVEVKGTRIKFQSDDEFSNWLAELIK